ncbi:MAG: hypothetical protein Q7J80_05490, partial [Anaerolineales bacterium]|nr:hypothetical protein [Anaerolineales bacterium]
LQEFNVYAQAWIDGITGQTDPALGLQSWIGYSTTDTDPSTWTNWIVAGHNGPSGNNDEFFANLGAEMTTEGTYYYASRFKYLDQAYVYGGFDGGFWDGVENVSGVLTVTTTPADPIIGFANLQWPASGTIEPLQEFNVYAQAWIDGITGQTDPAPGLQSWIGYSTTNTDPSTWTDWIVASHNGPSGNNDEFFANLGSEMTTEGTYYYASRFKYLDQAYVYGGFDGGFWDGITNTSGVLTVTTVPPEPVINFANLQWPASGTTEPLQEFNVYAQAWIDGITGQTDPALGLQSWIGYSTTNTDPSTWTNWIVASHNGPSGNNDEFFANLGSEMTTEGTYYYASRFKYLDQEFVYGGYSDGGGGFWDGTAYVSGVLTVVNEIIYYPVLFTVIDGTGLYSNIKFKGEMTNWEPVDMNQDGNVWTVSLDMLPGTYEWGVFEDDGSTDGIWLIEG